MALRDHLARFEGNPVLRGDSSDSGSAWSHPSCATEELGELPVYEFVSVPEEESFYHPPPMSLWVRLGPQPTKRLSKGDDVIFLAQGGLASHKFRLQKERKEPRSRSYRPHSRSGWKRRRSASIAPRRLLCFDKLPSATSPDTG